MNTQNLIITCEHGGNHVPKPYAELFANPQAKKALTSHRGYDPGALQLARVLARRLNAPLIYSTVTRLLVEPNRSLKHRQLFSEFTTGLDVEQRMRVLESYYHPHRSEVEHGVSEAIRRSGTALHLGVHSFTRRLRGITRQADIGLLYDPKRSIEREFAILWRIALRDIDSTLRTRRNYPYRGSADGLTTCLRQAHGPTRYAGIELEVCESLLTGKAETRDRVTAALLNSLRSALDQLALMSNHR